MRIIGDILKIRHTWEPIVDVSDFHCQVCGSRDCVDLKFECCPGVNCICKQCFENRKKSDESN